MSEPTASADKVSGYELRLEGHLDEHWYDWVADLTMTHEADGTTTLRSTRLDQAALHGMLAHARDLGVILISVTPLGHLDASRRR